MLAGADQVVEHEEIEPAVAVVAPIPGEDELARVAFSDKPSRRPAPDEVETASLRRRRSLPPAAKQEQRQAPRKAKPGQREIRAVAVVPVKGSPGGGDAELTAAMRKTLSAAGWPVVSKPQPDALTVVGRVKVEPKGEGQTVSLRWEVQIARRQDAGRREAGQ